MTMESLEPRAIWTYFAGICAIPHPSHHEERLADWLVRTIHAMGLEAGKDTAGNVVARKPAGPGCAGRQGVILQAHIDMVCQAAHGSSHDFMTDPIRPLFDPADPDWIMADGTTLGADNGIGMAAALAVLADRELRHGPLECLFTLGEEDGMTGAQGMQPGQLQGSWLLNLDSEISGELTIGCAGGIRTISKLSLPASPASAGGRWLEVNVDGLLGGHSGVDIHLGRGNATLLLCRLLSRAGGWVCLAEFEGGTAVNAIPRDARALVWVDEGSYEAWRTAMDAEMAVIRAGLGSADPGFRLTIREAGAESGTEVGSLVLESELTASVMAGMAGLPNGLQSMEPDFDDIPRTSSNLGVFSIRKAGGVLELETRVLVRSSDDGEKESLARAIESHLSALGADTRRLAETAAWPPEPSAELVGIAVSVYRELFGADPAVRSTHGGLECALFRTLYPGLRMISLGPTIRFPHSPDERVQVSTVALFWRYLLALLGRLP
ncbi:MAG: beta-Ala-His dipeptidase [Clostridia bacterium]